VVHRNILLLQSNNYAPQLGDTFLGVALHSLLVVMELDCVRTYIWLPASVPWFGLDWGIF
jgi:hypothetical protein